jgi:dipeptidyl aminopeptidase/acylaminoacyl peptidase
MAKRTSRRALTPDDYWRLQHITEMSLSPDGKYLAYVIERSDREENERRSEIWLMATETGVSSRFTAGTARDWAPRWSADGRQLAFLSTRGGKEAQVWLMLVDGGEARQVTSMRRGAAEPFWSSDGSWVGFSAEVRPGESPTDPMPSQVRDRERQERDEAERPRLYSKLVYRWDGKGYLEGRTKLFRVWLADGRIEPLTDGDFDDTEPVCSPDGRWLAFVSDRSERRDANMSTDLWLMDLDTRELRRLTGEHVVVLRPAWSPDGARLAFLATREVGEHSIYNTHLYVADAVSSAVADLFEGTDRSAEVQLTSDLPTATTSAPTWIHDGSAVFCLAQRGGGVEVLHALPDQGRIEMGLAAQSAAIKQVALAPDGNRLFALRCDPAHAWDVWSYPLGNKGKASGITRTNEKVFASVSIAEPEPFSFPSFDDREIEAWLYRPSARKPVPLVLSIHGGPHGAHGFAFSLLAQVLAGRGYAMLMINPRGSAGYGEAFSQACDRDWGGADFRDLMAGVDAALARGGLDGKRVAVMGGSYGGYMTNWIVTQTDRFRAAVSIYGIANLPSMFGTADMDVVWAQGDYGWPWENAEFYRERSPLTHVARVRTPIRIIGAEQDYRCPFSQCEEWYAWLRRQDHAPVELVRLPRASHTGYASPRQRVQRLELALEWIERYCPAD